jgi:Flp pilus assembly protein TadD
MPARWSFRTWSAWKAAVSGSGESDRMSLLAAHHKCLSSGRTTQARNSPAQAHRSANRARHLGAALKAKGDLDGAIAEYRAALRLQPDNAEGHYDLGRVLWTKGDPEAAQFHTAYGLAPNEPTIRQIYHNLTRQLER